METIRILVSDDHPVVLDGLIAILNTQPHFEIVGHAKNGQEVIAQAKSLHPDVILLDIEMPEMDGLEALKTLSSELPESKVIIFTAYDTDDRIVGAVKAGAKGYLLKGSPREELFKAIDQVAKGGSLLQPIVASRLLEHISSEKRGETELLTFREKEVLDLLAQGKQNKEIAVELVIKERTVKFHVSSILSKLGAGNRTEAVTIAAQRGLIDLKE